MPAGKLVGKLVSKFVITAVAQDGGKSPGEIEIGRVRSKRRSQDFDGLLLPTRGIQCNAVHIVVARVSSQRPRRRCVYAIRVITSVLLG